MANREQPKTEKCIHPDQTQLGFCDTCGADIRSAREHCEQAVSSVADRIVLELKEGSLKLPEAVDHLDRLMKAFDVLERSGDSRRD